MKAIWNGTIIAESKDTVVVEGNHYFPEATLKAAFFSPSSKTTTCFWKGEASYLNIAFWRGVEVVE